MELCGSKIQRLARQRIFWSHILHWRKQKLAFGVEEEIISSQYLALLVISTVFSILAIYRRTAILDGIAWISWYIAGGAHLVSSPPTSTLFSMSYLWFAIGTVFFFLLWTDIFKLWSFRKNRDDWMDEEL